MQIAVCDDEIEQVNTICLMLSELCGTYQIEAEVRGFTDGKKFLAYAARVHVDIAFLDIYMDEHSGIEAAGILRSFNASCAIIFVTSSQEHAVEAFGLDACHYLVKPVAIGKLAEALQRAKLINPAEKTLTIVSDYANLRVPLDEILYIDIVDKITLIHLKNAAVIRSRAPLGKLAAALVNEPRFLMCHRSIIVNADFIRRFAEQDIELTDRTRVPVSQKRVADVKSRYREYLFAKVRGNTG